VNGNKETEIGPIPGSWKVVPFGSLGRVGNGSTPKKTIPDYWNGGSYPWLTSAKVYDRDIVSADQFVTAQALAECHLPRLSPGAVLIAITGQGKTLGHCAVLRMEATVSQHIAYLATDTKRADPSFVRAYLETKYDYLRQVASGGGSTKGALTCAFLRDLPIPLPALDEQRAIARALDHATYAIELEQRAEERIQEIKRVAMQELFTRGLRGEPQRETELGSVPESWKLDIIGNHYLIASGGTPAREVPAYWQGGTIPWVKTTEVDYGIIEEAEEYITMEGLQSSAAKVFPAGTLLLAMYGQGVTRGKVAILGIEAACNQACAAMKPADNAIDPKYLFFFLTSRYEDIRRLAHGGQQQNLNLDIVRNLVVSYPTDIGEQREIVTILEAIDRKIDLHKRKRAVLEELFKSLLHKLMTGEIRVSDLNLSALPPSPSPEPSL
jgi:type I restriction enzyme, S subunit